MPFLAGGGKEIPGSVSGIVRVNIGGVPQGIILRGRNAEKPVLLFLHGGPGSPVYPIAKNYPTGLEDLFTVAWWDQRGAGLSWSKTIPPQSMTTKQLIDDAIEVTEYLRHRFSREKIYLMGHSWGTYLGVFTVRARPDLYHAYVGTGQVVDQTQSEKDLYNYMLHTARENGDVKLEQRLLRFDHPENLSGEYMMVRNPVMNKQGVGMMHKKRSMFREIMLPVLRVREYTLGDKYGYMQGGIFSSRLVGDILTNSLMDDMVDLPVPVYICQGHYDRQTSYDLARRYFQHITAPVKGFYTFDQSAHSPFVEEPEKFRRILAEDVLRGRTDLADR
jgi:pimeloyl-ACP methyl ester carboxylesterase